MATVKYFIRGKSSGSTIYCRFSINRNQVFTRKTGYSINPINWSSVKGKPKEPKDADDKENINKTNDDLVDLRKKIIAEYNSAYKEGREINGKWLGSVINAFNNQEERNELDYLVSWAKHYVEIKPTEISKNGIGVSEGTMKKYHTIIRKLEEFEKESKTTYLLKDVCADWGRGFIKFLSQSQGLKNNTIGKYLKVVKTIVAAARKSGLPVHPQLDDFRGFNESVETIALTNAEIKLLQQSKFINSNLEAAKDWLLIGCFTGQRVSDLLRMNPSMVEELGAFELIVIKQVKGGKTVQIPIHPVVKEILNKRGGLFPPTFSNTPGSNTAMFNKYIKNVCRQVGINTIVPGTLFNHVTKRSEEGNYEKWQLVTSHICRRSFATNFYSTDKYPTPLLMNITGHSTEKQFLEYIGKPPLDYSIQLAKIWAKLAVENMNEPTRIFEEEVNNG